MAADQSGRTGHQERRHRVLTPLAVAINPERILLHSAEHDHSETALSYSQVT